MRSYPHHTQTSPATSAVAMAAVAAAAAATLLLLLVAPAAGEIKTMKISSDGRPLILLERFGFTHTGHVSLSLSAVSYSSSLTSPDPSLFGFFLLSKESLLRLLLEQQQRPQQPQQPQQQSCPIKSHYALTLLSFADLAGGESTNRSVPVHLPGEYSLFFANCNPETSVSFAARIEVYNLDGATKSYLPAGLTQLPALYFLFFLAYAAFVGVWAYACAANRSAAHRIHLLMGALLVMKALDLLCAAEDKHYVKVTGTPHGWDVVFYVFQFIKGVLFFTVVVLVGTGWSFLKPFLQDREKKVLIVVIPLQVVANIAAAVMGETGPFIKDWMTWKQLFLIIDIVCCCAIIFPIVWSIRSLRETSKTDGKAARNLAKLTLFRKFYILVVGYLYFTRIVVFALETIAAYNYQWVGAAMGEVASLTFYGLMFYMFRPVERNEYFVIDDEEQEAALAALRDDEFEL